MDFDEYWQLLVDKNPKLLQDVIKVKQTGLKAMLKQSFDYGKAVRSVKIDKNNECEVVDQLKNMFRM